MRAAHSRRCGQVGQPHRSRLGRRTTLARRRSAAARRVGHRDRLVAVQYNRRRSAAQGESPIRTGGRGIDAGSLRGLVDPRPVNSALPPASPSTPRRLIVGASGLAATSSSGSGGSDRVAVRHLRQTHQRARPCDRQALVARRPDQHERQHDRLRQHQRRGLAVRVGQLLIVGRRPGGARRIVLAAVMPPRNRKTPIAIIACAEAAATAAAASTSVWSC